jgi:hypothetical protein
MEAFLSLGGHLNFIAYKNNLFKSCSLGVGYEAGSPEGAIVLAPVSPLHPWSPFCL